MARSFSLALNDLFKIDNSLADLDAAVSEKCVSPFLTKPSQAQYSYSPPSPRKKAVSTQTSELEALEARLKATEERLKAKGAPVPASGRSSPRPRAPLASDTFTSTTSAPKTESPTSPLASEFSQRPATANRPQTGKKQESYSTPPMPGQLPPTPGASEGESSSESEYVLVKAAADDTPRKDGDVPPPTQ